MAKKYHKLGTLMKKDGRYFVALGKPGTDKWSFNAQVVVFKGSKDEPRDVVKQENGFLSIFPPKNENAPESIIGDLMISVEDSEE